jgi:hypothetical protein
MIVNTPRCHCGEGEAAPLGNAWQCFAAPRGAPRNDTVSRGLQTVAENNGTGRWAASCSHASYSRANTTQGNSRGACRSLLIPRKNAMQAALAGHTPSFGPGQGLLRSTQRCAAANAAAALVNISENTSAAVDGDAADHGREGSDPLKSLGKAARASQCSAACGTGAAKISSRNKRHADGGKR